MTVDRVTEVTGLTRAEIYRVSSRMELGAPAHFIYANGIVAFSLAGLCQLAEGMQEEQGTAAKALLHEIAAIREREAMARAKTPDEVEAHRISKRWDVRVEVSISRMEDAA